MKGNKTFMNDFKFFINLNESFTINEAKKPEPTKEEVENLRKQFEQALKKDWGEIEKSINQCIDDIGEADPDKKSKCKILNPSKAAKAGIYNEYRGKFVGAIFVYNDPEGLKSAGKYITSNIAMVERKIHSSVKYLNKYLKKYSSKIKLFADPDVVNGNYYITAMLVKPD